MWFLRRPTPARPFAPRSASHRVISHVSLIAVVVIVAVACSLLQNRLPPARVTLVLALFAAVGGAVAALLALLAARLTADRLIGWLSLVLAYYSLLAIPTTVIGTLDIAPAAAVEAVRFLIQGVVVVFLMVALTAEAPPAGWRAVRAALSGAVLIAGVGGLALAFPVPVQAITMSRQLELTIALVWSVLAITIAVGAAERQEWALWRIAGGLALLAVADAGWVTAAISPPVDLGLVFSTIRLIGVGLALWGTARLAREALCRLTEEQTTHEDDLRSAEIQLARSAERDHELRNGLAGLAGATSLMRTDTAESLLTHAVASELSRLDELLRTTGDDRVRPDRSNYAVRPVLEGLVALRAATGMDIRLATAPGLYAIGSSTVLAQVVTNLIENAAQHAPGSPVRVSAVREGDQIMIRVRDFGPGVSPGREQAVFEPLVCDDERAVGMGLGLHICRRLLEDANGSIAVRPATPGRVGCTVVVRVPAVSARAQVSGSLLAAGD